VHCLPERDGLGFPATTVGLHRGASALDTLGVVWTASRPPPSGSIAAYPARLEVAVHRSPLSPELDSRADG
jgi:hypothetical protein